MESFRRIWQSGYEGQHIEELIGGVFSDFAPYAAAEHRRLSLVRQYGTHAATSVTVEESGDLLFNVGHIAAGSSMFATTGLMQIEANLKVPVPPPTAGGQAMKSHDANDESSSSRNDNNNNSSSSVAKTRGATAAPSSSSSSHEPSATPVDAGGLRFVSTHRGAQLFFGIPPVSRPPCTLYRGRPLPSETHAPNNSNSNSGPAAAGGAVAVADAGRAFGQLEVETTIPALWYHRSALGGRIGPIAARVSRVPTMVQVPDPNLSGSLDNTMGSETMRERSAAMVMQETTLYTLDAAVCVPLAELSDGGSGAGQAAPNTTASPQRVSGDHRPATAPPSTLSLTLGLQHPFAPATNLVGGDTLVGIAVQNDRGVSDAYQAAAVVHSSSGDRSQAAEADAGRERRMEFSPQENTFRVLVVQTLFSASPRGGGGAGTSASGLRTSSRLHNTSSATGLSSSSDDAARPWYALPTLIGCNMSFRHQLLRLSVASIFHDGEVDVEAAAIVDATPLLPSTPTLLKAGWNSTGRLALGITSMFYDAMCITLGVHAMPGEEMRFGLEIKV